MSHLRNIGQWLGLSAMIFGLVACGSNDVTNDVTTVENNYTAEDYAGYCNATDEKTFVRLYLEQYYLWPDKISYVNPSNYSYASDYYYDMLAPYEVDRFSYAATTATANDNLAGIYVSYGLDVIKLTNGSNTYQISYVEPNSAASKANLQRGALVTVSSYYDVYDQIWWPSNTSSYLNLSVKDTPSSTARSVSLKPERLTTNPVPIANLQTASAASGNKKWGYLHVRGFEDGTQTELYNKLLGFSQSGIQELVLDLRYNPGGYLYIARSLASMLTGTSNDGKVFERFINNGRYPLTEANSVLRFSNRIETADSQTNATGVGVTLPRLNLQRIFILTSSTTCSASESVINALRGVDIPVILVGNTTCGKPYAMLGVDNCGTSYFPVEFQGINAKGFGDYSKGFTPTCYVADDLNRPLGDPAEAQLATALNYMATGSCNTSSVAYAQSGTSPHPTLLNFMQAQPRSSRPRLPGSILKRYIKP